MKMRNIFKIVLGILVLGLTSCEKDLTLVPEDTLSPETFFSNREELELWTNSFYLQLDGADDLFNSNDDTHIDQGLGALIEGQRDPASEGGWNWSMLRRINYYLQNSENCQDEAARNEFDGVAYFMRAYFYFEKVKRYGDVPWYDQVLGSADDELLFQKRDDRGYVMDRVIEDLDRAIELLPANKNIARVTKWTALALKTRAALYEGTFRKYHNLGDWEKYLQHVADAGENFISNSGYTIYKAGSEPYRELFISDHAKQEEVILARIYSSTANLMTSIQFNINNVRQGFTKSFMNHYLMKDGSRFSDQPDWETAQYEEETQNRDPRLQQTVLSPGYRQIGENSTKVNDLTSLTGYQSIKFVSSAAYNGANKGEADWPLFRTAEVYLNYAEAKAELGTLSQADLDASINQIRSRVGMPSLNIDQANANPDPFLVSYYHQIDQGNSNLGVLLEIRRERTVELVAEGFRIDDLLRWKEGQLIVQPLYGMYFPGPGYYDLDNDGSYDLALWADQPLELPGGTIKQIGVDVVLSEGTSGFIHAFPNNNLSWDEGRDYLYPIPTDERVLSGGVLSQNPGWVDSSGY